jgi:hypothetical protein
LKTLYKLFCLTFIYTSAYAQIGGDNTFEFLNLVPSAHAAALGGNAIATRTDDLSLIYQNPALLDASMNNEMQLSFSDYFEKINFGQIGYAHNFDKPGMLAATFHYINYGSFKSTDEAANDLGTFSAGEYSLGLSWSKPLDSLFYIGASIKGIYSKLESYSSTGVASDIAGIYISKNKSFCAALVAKNIGRQLSQYESNGTEPLPFETQIGISKKLLKAPFRFGVTWQHLEIFDITYNDPSVGKTDALTGEKKDNSISFFNKCVRHVVLNTELVFSKNFNIRIGYNFQRRSELSNENHRGLVGLSGGFGIKISKFMLDYAHAVFHLKEATNQFTIGFRISDFSKS